MDEIISKELLSAILGTELEVTRYELDKNEILFYLMPQNGIEFGRTINIYELMAMAVEWALEPVKGKVGFIVHIEPIVTTDNGVLYVGHIEDNGCFTIFDGQDETLVPIYSTETANKRYISVFQACQWVYDNKVKGDLNE